MKTLILTYDDETYESFGCEEGKEASEVSYWVRRRMEKSCRIPKRAFICDKEIDVEPIKKKYYDDQDKWEDERQALKDKAEYERLKQKYGK